MARWRLKGLPPFHSFSSSSLSVAPPARPRSPLEGVGANDIDAYSQRCCTYAVVPDNRRHPNTQGAKEESCKRFKATATVTSESPSRRPYLTEGLKDLQPPTPAVSVSRGLWKTKRGVTSASAPSFAPLSAGKNKPGR